MGAVETRSHALRERGKVTLSHKDTSIIETDLVIGRRRRKDKLTAPHGGRGRRPRGLDGGGSAAARAAAAAATPTAASHGSGCPSSVMVEEFETHLVKKGKEVLYNRSYFR